jgi:hypothetical protein
MMIDPQIKSWLEIAELGLKSLAIIGAGAWAVLLHRLLRKREVALAGLRHKEAQIRDLDLNAKHTEAKIQELDLKTKYSEEQTLAEIRGLNLNTKRTEAEIRDLDLKCKQQALVQVDIRPEVHPTSDSDGYLILATVKLTNRGTRNTRIKWRDQPPAFYVHEVTFDEEGKPDFGNRRDFQVPLTLHPDLDAISHIIRAGGAESIPFAVRVTTPGLYLLSFRGSVDEAERNVSANTGAELPVSWTARKFVLVSREQPDAGV